MASTSTRKRKLSDDEHINPAPRKKAKMMMSALFHSELDQNQFLHIYHSIEESALIHSLGVPNDVNREIAEFSVGRKEFCHLCSGDISVLNGHEQIIKNDGIDYLDDCNKKYMIYFEDVDKNRIGYNFCGRRNRYFCNECFDYITIGECQSCYTSSIVPKDTPQCKICESYTAECLCGERTEFKCDCSKYGSVWCHHCFTCLDCRATKSAQDWECDQCRNVLAD